MGDLHGTDRFVVVGHTHLARRVCSTLGRLGFEVVHLPGADDDRFGLVVGSGTRGVAIVMHDDVAALRCALAAAHADPEARLLVTVFDRTMGEQLRELLPHCEAVSPAALSASSLAGPCLDRTLAAVRSGPAGLEAVLAEAFRGDAAGGAGDPWGGARDDAASGAGDPPAGAGDAAPGAGEAAPGDVGTAGPHGPEWLPWSLPRGHRRRGWVGRAVGQLRPHDEGTRIMFAGLVGIAVVLFTDWLWMSTHGDTSASAFQEAARVVATVGPAADVHDPVYQVASGLAMLATLVMTGVFTAGLVDRLLGPRLVGLVGARALPRSGHVLVVGLGQVGLRLCMELRRIGVPVVAIEREATATNLRLARTARIPVVVGHGGDRAVLERLGLGRALALAAVGSDDLDNIAVAVAAHGVDAGTRVVLRVGEDDAGTDARSLLPLGVTRDVTSLSAAYVVGHLLGERPSAALADDHRLFVELPGVGLAPRSVAPGCRCAVSGAPAGSSPLVGAPS